jgi:hypothetical protein
VGGGDWACRSEKAQRRAAWPPCRMAALHKAKEEAYTVDFSNGQGPTRMRFFRSHRFKTALLALFALTCQLALSFGHVHLDRRAGNPSHWAVLAATTTVMSADLPTPPRSRNGPGEDFCAICTSVSLEGVGRSGDSGGTAANSIR